MRASMSLLCISASFLTWFVSFRCSRIRLRTSFWRNARGGTQWNRTHGAPAGSTQMLTSTGGSLERLTSRPGLQMSVSWTAWTILLSARASSHLTSAPPHSLPPARRHNSPRLTNRVWGALTETCLRWAVPVRGCIFITFLCVGMTIGYSCATQTCD